MMVNSASPRPEATAPITAVELATSPPTGASTCTAPPSGRVSFASGWPDVTVSPGSARIAATFSPGRSGRTAVSSRGMMMPAASTIEEKQAFAALSTVTAAPFGASGSSAAREGDAEAKADNPATSGASSFRESGDVKGFIGIRNPVFDRYRYQTGGSGAKRQGRATLPWLVQRMNSPSTRRPCESRDPYPV